MTFRPVAITVLVLALTGAACGSGGGDADSSGALQDRIKVSGDFGQKPEIDISTPLKVGETTSWVATGGKGDRVGSEATTILALTLADGRTGRTAVSTHDDGQRPLEVKLGDQVFPSLARALVGKPADSRVVVASTSEDAYGDTGASQLGIRRGDSVVMVADILSTDPTGVLDGPTGESHQVPHSAPALQVSGADPVGFDFTGRKRPTSFRAIVLRDGTGPRIEPPDRIAADYIGQVWGAKQPFDSTYGKEPARFSIGLGGVLKAWDRGLAGLREGARVMLICPPSSAYGTSAQPGIPSGSTLVFVVDVLGVG